MKGKGSLGQAAELVEEAIGIPQHFSVALQFSAGSSAQAQEHQENIETLRSLLGELLKKIVDTQQWVAEMRDSLFRKTYW